MKDDNMETAIVRNLDDMEEGDGQRRPTRASALVLASFGGACIVFAALALMRSPEPETTKNPDPLGDLVAQSKAEEPPKRDDGLEPHDVTFPGVLTDQDNPTTAMEAVRRRDVDPEGELPRADLPFDGPPPATDRLPVMPLPAQDVLAGTREDNVARADTLRSVARHVARESEQAALAEPGAPGGYQLQVSSFKEQGEAEAFAMVLRRRGHKAHVEQAHVKGRGLWHRVRIGPFKYRRSADIYRQDFEAKERIVGFVINPPTTQVRIAVKDSADKADGADEKIDIREAD